jgi:hypothetical protein
MVVGKRDYRRVKMTAGPQGELLPFFPRNALQLEVVGIDEGVGGTVHVLVLRGV